MPALPKPGTKVDNLKCPKCGKKINEQCVDKDCPQKLKKG